MSYDQVFHMDSKTCCASLASCFGCADLQRILTPSAYIDVKNFFHAHAPYSEVPLIHKEILEWRTRAKLAVRGNAMLPEIYRNNLKNRAFDKEASQNSHLEQATIVRAQGASEDESFEKKPTPSKTDSSGCFGIGLFQQGTHQVVPLPHCPLHHPAINRAYGIVYDTMKQMRIAPYVEKNHSGLIRYLQFVVERKSRRVQLTIVATREDPVLEKWVKQLYIEGGFHSIWLNLQSAQTNTIFGNTWKFLMGESYVEEKIADVFFYFHPACFMQAHLSLFEELVRSVQRNMKKDKKVIDLYAGVGVIGLNCAKQSKAVTCVEWSPFAEECFTLSLLKCAPEIQNKAVFYQGPVEKYAHEIMQAEVIIVDPPRKGLDPQVLQAIMTATHAQQIVYISCNPLSFFRDCLLLLEKGWKITYAETYLLFPGSDHVEVLCFLEKESG